MTEASPLAWTRHAAGRLVARLGVVEVGEVSPSLFPGSPVGAHWRVFLPGVQTPCPRPARNVEAGQRRVEHIVMDWIDAAALAPATARELAVRAFRAETSRAEVSP